MSSLVRLALFAVAAACLLRPAEAQPPAGKGGPAFIQTKKYTLKDKAAGDKEMEYTLYVPSSYDKAKKAPLVIALHGLWSNPQQIIRYKGLTEQAEKYGCIVAAPMGYNNHGWYGLKIPLGRTKDDPENLNELSEKDVLNVLGIVQKDHAVDPDRVYLMGHSMGGAGTFHLAMKYPDKWAALAPIAPALLVPATDLEKVKKLPVILVQGDKDFLCPVGTARKWAEQMKTLGMTYEYVEVAGGDHVNVAFEKMPAIFEFLAKHKRGAKAAGAAAPGDDATRVAAVKKLAEKVGEATLKTDVGTILNHTHPGLIKALGGRAAAVEQTEKLMKAITDRGFKFLAFKVGTPGDFLTEGGNTFVVVPTTVTMSIPDGKKAVMRSYLLGISPDGGKTWAFADGSGLDKQDFRDQVLPKLPAALKLPEKGKPEIIDE
jgi:poly(3-hydroxybutyrate) depolymerase